MHEATNCSSEGTSTTTSISTRDMECMVDKLKMQKHRNSTKNNCHSIWKQFNEFFIHLDLKPDTWEEHLELFVAYLVNSNKKSTTVKSYISAIKAVLIADNVYLQENRYLLSVMTKACRYRNDHVRTRLPIKCELLNLILQETAVYLDGELGQHYLACLYKALFVSGYYGLLRVGEMTSGLHPVFATDVSIGVNKKKILFRLHTSKTHWYCREGIKNKDLGLWCIHGLLANVSVGVSVQLNDLVAGNGSYILRPCGHDLHGPTSPFLR